MTDAKDKGVAPGKSPPTTTEPVDENKLIAERRTKLAAIRESAKQATQSWFVLVKTEK